MSITTGELLARNPRTTVINAGGHAGKREIRGAIRYRPSDLLLPEHLSLPIAREERVILYAEHGSDETLNRIAGKMQADGFIDVRIYDGTFADYEAAGGATQEASTEQVVPPARPDEEQALDRRL